MKRLLLGAVLSLVLLAQLLPARENMGEERGLLRAQVANARATGAEAAAVDFEGVTPVPAELQGPVREAIAAATLSFGRADRLTVSVVERYERFAHLVLVPTAVVESGWQLPLAEEEIVEVYALAGGDDVWQAYVLDESTLPVLRELVPAEVADFSDRAPVAETFLFPWTGGNWWLKLGYPGWHGNNAVDFKPTDAGDRQVLAAAGGTLSQVCNDGYQSILRIAHGSGWTRYLHLDAGSIPGQLLNQSVEQGEPLGRLYDGHAIDDGYCYDSPDWQFNTHCGCGTVMHLHFESSDRAMSIDGYTYGDVAASAMGTPYLSHNGSALSPYPDARFLSQEVPATMVAGEAYEVALTFQNVGSEAWGDGYRLGARNPMNNVTWGVGRVYFPTGETVEPGESKRLAFTVTAPTIPGMYDFQWRLLRAEGEWIGDKSATVSVEVVDAQPEGVLEQPAAATVSGVISVAGWAAVEGSTVETLEVWVDGQHTGDATYGTPRVDAGGNYGFQWRWDTTGLTPGRHDVQARAVAATGEASWLPLVGGDPPPVAVTVNALPSGYVERPVPGQTVSGMVRIEGWSSVHSAAVGKVEVYVDDRYQGNAVYGTPRPDAGGNYGFYWDWDADEAGSGAHTVRLRAVSSTGSSRWLPSAVKPWPTTIPVSIGASSQPGDADGDGRVDGHDYVIWLSHQGNTTTNGATDGDFNGDGQVDDQDYTIWMAHYDE